MEFDFTSIMDRQGKDAVALDFIPIPGASVKPGFSKIPMWVADMNFPVVPTITQAIIERAQHPAFGYFMKPRDYYASIIRWQERRNGVKGLAAENIEYENGVLGGVVSAVQAFSAPGEAILIHSPTYIGFKDCLENNGRKMVYSPLVRDSGNIWRMDFEDMEKKLAENRIHLAVFCSPHNPCGRVWERWEIERAMELFKKYECVVISDEIWSDILLNGHKHIPTQSVSEDARERTIALYAPSKTFNLAGLVGSYHIIYNKYLRDRLRKQSGMSHYNNPNVLSVRALIGAYKPEGERWVNELCSVLSGNVNFACDYIEKHFSGVELSKPEGTYMLYLDCGAWCAGHGKTLDELLRAGVSVGVIWQDGRPFERDMTIRMNLALPRSLVEEAFDRLDKYVFNKAGE